MDNSQLKQEQQLFLLISEGDEKAFKSLYDLLLPKFLPYLYKLLQSEGSVQEVLQDALIKFWLSRHRLKDIEHPHAWLFRIIANEAFRHLRKEKLQLEMKDKFQVDYAGKISLGSLQTDLDVSFLETQRIIRSSVEMLSNRQKTIYQLSREAGFSIPQIAEQLGLSVHYVKKTLMLALRIVQQKLQQEGVHLPIFLLLLSI